MKKLPLYVLALSLAASQAMANTEQLQTALATDPVLKQYNGSVYEVTADVTDGKATLSGVVMWPSEMNRAEQIAAQFNDVTRIQDNIKIWEVTYSENSAGGGV